MTNFAKVDQALKGLIAPMDLSDAEQEQYFDSLGENYREPSPITDAFYKRMRDRGEGVGMDDAGNIIYGPNEKSKPINK